MAVSSGVAAVNSSVAAVSNSGRAAGDRTAEPRGAGKVIDCQFCKLTHVTGRCPAYSKRFNLCHQFSHFECSRMCQGGGDKKSLMAIVVEDSWEEHDEEFYVHGVKANNE